MCLENEKLVAYTRLVPAGVSFAEVSIGRVVSSPSVRGRGFGKILMEKSIEESDRLFGKESIRIGAQFYLLDFYKSFGFLPEGEIYLEDDTEHIEMILHRSTQ
jgi:ElaA protein